MGAVTFPLATNGASMTPSDQRVIEQAADGGITYFDTARGYQNGNNERMVGAALKGRRDKITLSSKSQAKTKSEASAHLDKSLAELGTDHLDIWYLHSRPSPASVPDELFDAQDEAVKAGASPATVEIVDIHEVPLAYLPGNATRIRVRAAGDLAV